MATMKCPHCGSERIEIGVAWGKSSETGNVGLKYRAGGGFFGGITGVVQAYSDLCLNCGTIVRTYIKEDTSKEWIKTPGSLGSK